MQISKKNKDHEGCFLYWRDTQPYCLLTHLMSVAKWFNDDKEAIEFRCIDCNGEMDNCPYIDILWGTEKQEEIKDKTEEEIKNEIEKNEEYSEEELAEEENTIFNIGNITLDFEFSMPFDNDIRTDALLIPTDTDFRFDRLFNFYNLNDSMYEECRKRMAVPFKVGEFMITPGLSSGFPYISHCVVMNNSDTSPDLQAVGMSIYNALIDLDEKQCKSISVAPMVFVDKDIIVPNTEKYLQALMISILTYQEEIGFDNIEYIIIHIFNDLNVSLQELLSNINN